MNLYRKFTGIITLTSVSFFLFSCGGENKKEPETANVEDSSQTATDTSALSQLYSLPTPMLMASAIKNMKGNYNESYIAPVLANLSKAKGTESEKAFALGAYSVDLGYAAMFNQPQVAFKLFGASAQIARSLNIEGEITQPTVDRMKANLGNQDSVTQIVLATFNRIHNSLYDHERKPVALHIIAGAYIEGAYLALKTYSTTKNEEIRQVIGEQKVFLENIAELAKQENMDGKNDDLIAKFDGLMKAYESVNIKVENAKISKIELSDKDFESIQKSIEDIRNSII